MHHIDNPTIWRQFIIPSDTDMRRVHQLLVAGFGWAGGHAHAMKVLPIRERVEPGELPKDLLQQVRKDMEGALEDGEIEAHEVEQGVKSARKAIAAF
jgi:hypothetical protein